MVRSASDDPSRPDGGGAPFAKGRGDGSGGAGDAPQDAELADLSTAYAAQFAEIGRTLSVFEGFGLLPIETPSADVGRALAGWLARQGYDTYQLALAGDEWRDLVRFLLTVPSEARSVAVVIGPRTIDADVREGLRLLNQLRDTVADSLQRPLLWCGSRGFHEATWDFAPDFWSIREISIAVRRDAAPVTPRSARSDAVVRQIGPAEDPELLEAQIAAAKAHGDLLNASRIQLRLAWSHLSLGDFRRAEELAREALAVFQRAGAPGRLDEARSYEILGDIAYASSADAEASYRAALATYVASGDRHGTARVTLKLGATAHRRGDLIAAGPLYERAFASYQELGDRAGEASVLYFRADLRRDQGDLAGATNDYDDALKLYQVVDDRRGQAMALMGRGALRQGQDDLTGAGKDYDDALKLFQLVGDRLGQARALQARGAIARAR